MKKVVLLSLLVFSGSGSSLVVGMPDDHAVPDIHTEMRFSFPDKNRENREFSFDVVFTNPPLVYELIDETVEKEISSDVGAMKPLPMDVDALIEEAKGVDDTDADDARRELNDILKRAGITKQLTSRDKRAQLKSIALGRLSALKARMEERRSYETQIEQARAQGRDEALQSFRSKVRQMFEQATQTDETVEKEISSDVGAMIATSQTVAKANLDKIIEEAMLSEWEKKVIEAYKSDDCSEEVGRLVGTTERFLKNRAVVRRDLGIAYAQVMKDASSLSSRLRRVINELRQAGVKEEDIAQSLHSTADSSKGEPDPKKYILDRLAGMLQQQHQTQIKKAKAQGRDEALQSFRSKVRQMFGQATQTDETVEKEISSDVGAMKPLPMDVDALIEEANGVDDTSASNARRQLNDILQRAGITEQLTGRDKRAQLKSIALSRLGALKARIEERRSYETQIEQARQEGALTAAQNMLEWLSTSSRFAH